MKWVLIATMALAMAACEKAKNAETPATSGNQPAAASEASGLSAATAAPASSGLSAATAAPASSGVSAAAAAPAPQYREVTIPAGTALRLELKSAVGSDSSNIEDAVRASLRQPVSVNGSVVLPAGTDLAGSVTAAERSGRVKGRARIAYRFNSLTYGGERYDIRTAQLTHVAPATKGEDATKIGIGAGAGAAVGAILGGGSGAAKGAAIGGAGGTGVVLATRGKEVRLGPGAEVNTRLTEPLTIRVRVSG
jgi:hypothetical protein